MKRHDGCQRLRLFLLLIAVAGSPGCGLIFGGDQRVDNRSHDYTVVRLDRDTGAKNSEWHRLVPSSADASDDEEDIKHPKPEDVGDIAFEHGKTGSIISLNSVCREYREAS